MVVTTLSLSAAKALPAAKRRTNSASRFMGLLERVRAMRADGELQLEEQLVDGAEAAVLGVAQLRAQLAELRRPEGQRRGDAFVAARVVEVRAIEADAGEP